MSTGDPYGELNRLLGPVEVVLSGGLEGLRRKDERKRTEQWNLITENQDAFEVELLPTLAPDIKAEMSARFCLARLFLAAAAYTNGEDSLTMDEFNTIEIELLMEFEKFNIFDVLTTEEIVQRIARKEDIYELVIEFYQKQYSRLDNILEDPEIQKDLKLAFKTRYTKRFDKVVKGVQAYVGRYGPNMVVAQVEKKIWDQIKASEDQRRNAVADLERQLSSLSDSAGPLDVIDEANELLRENLSMVETGLAAGDRPQDVGSLESRKDDILDRYLNIERGLSSQTQLIGEKRRELEAREAELELAKNEYQEQMQEEKRRVVESELAEIKTLKEDLAAQEQEFELERAELARKRDELDSRLQDIKDAMEGKPIRIVAKEDARLCELNFIGRFDTKLGDFPIEFRSPVDDKKYVIKSWKEGSHAKIAEETIPDMPANIRSRYAVIERKWGFVGQKQEKVVVEAVSLCHLPEYEKYGFDARRANVSDFLGSITRFINAAEMGKYLHVIGLASPTGWDNRVRNEIESTEFAHNYMSRHVSICLIDSVTGEVFYNPADERISNFVDFFKPQFDEERVAKVREFILNKLNLKNYVVFNDLLEEVNEKREIVDKAFYDFESDRDYRTRIIKEVGMVLEPAG